MLADNLPQKFYRKLISQQESIGQRYRAIFQLKHLISQQVIKMLIQSFPFLGDSQLLKHQLVYSLGQINQQYYPYLKQFLFKIVENQKQQKLVRHQAAQAIANYFDQSAVNLLMKHQKCGISQLQVTCDLSLFKLRNIGLKQRYGKLYFGTREPVAPFEKNQFQQFLKQKNLEKLYQQQGFLGILLQPIEIINKYRILYYLRNLNTQQSKEVLCKLLSLKYFKSQCSLFKHQICFVLGQIGLQSNYQQQLIRECIQNIEQQDIVRHQALAAIASQSKDQKYLEKFRNYPNQIIRQSALVAIDSIAYWKN